MDTLLLLIVAGLCAVSSHAERQYHFVYVKKNMTAARSYCRENYTDLASFDSMEDVMTVLNMTDYPKLTEAGSSFRVWIGLYDDRYNWKWSLANTSFYKDGETEYRSWGSGQPNNKKGAERCSKMTSLGGWHDKRCEEHGVAVCSDVREIATPSVPVRLVNSNSYCSGRVEIFHNGQWGAVCDDSWDLNDAHVVCRQLGCGWAREAPHSARFGQGTGQIWLDDLQCSGTESSLTDCQHGGLGIHNCAHSEDASVICEEFPTPTPSPPVRLVNSNSRCSGRVEIFHNGQWGTVCDDSWDGNDAQVVCRQLGCGRALGAPELAHFGQGTGQTWLDDLQCSGTESSLIHCPHGGLGIHNCAHSEDASVICEEVDPPSPSVPVRLINSNSYCSGRVEIFHNGQWGTVCDDLWNLNDTQVVCRQLGCGRAVKAPHSARFGQGTGQIWLDDLQCSGSEPSLTDCQHGGLGNHNCAHSDDASVICEGYNVTFVFINISMTWAQAQSYCRAHYTDLASVRNRAEQLKVQELIPAEKSAWIGLFRDGWKWSDGSNLSFTNWRDGDPRGSATCVVADLTQNGTWINWRCDAERAFICYSKPKTTKQAKTEQATTKQATKKRATTKQDMKKQVKTKQVFRLKFKKTDPSLDLNDPDVVERILKQLKQKLKDKGLDDNIKLSWKKQPDGKVFHKEEKKTKKTKKKTKKVEL